MSCFLISPVPGSALLFPLQIMLLELLVSRLASDERPRSFWHSRLHFYEPLWIKEHTVYMSPEAPWSSLLESRLKGTETAQGLSQHQGLIAFDLQDFLWGQLAAWPGSWRTSLRKKTAVVSLRRETWVFASWIPISTTWSWVFPGLGKGQAFSLPGT